jgi:hypothetical protein
MTQLGWIPRGFPADARSYRFEEGLDRRGYDLDAKALVSWPPGPWDGEPDKVVWVDPDTGLDCMINRNHHGVWCGYVGVPRTHPWHGSDYNAVEADAHGGLSFAGPCFEDACEDESGVCHTERAEVGPVWWFGFDCAHLHDRVPGIIGWPEFPGEPSLYWTVDMVRDEVTRLAEEVAYPWTG